MIEQSLTGGVCERHSMSNADKCSQKSISTSRTQTSFTARASIHPVSKQNHWSFSALIFVRVFLRLQVGDVRKKSVIPWVMKQAFGKWFAGYVYYGPHSEEIIHTHTQTPKLYHTCLCIATR